MSRNSLPYLKFQFELAEFSNLHRLLFLKFSRGFLSKSIWYAPCTWWSSSFYLFLGCVLSKIVVKFENESFSLFFSFLSSLLLLLLCRFRCNQHLCTLNPAPLWRHHPLPRHYRFIRVVSKLAARCAKIRCLSQLKFLSLMSKTTIFQQGTIC